MSDYLTPLYSEIDCVLDFLHIISAAKTIFVVVVSPMPRTVVVLGLAPGSVGHLLYSVTVCLISFHIIPAAKTVFVVVVPPLPRTFVF